MSEAYEEATDAMERALEALEEQFEARERTLAEKVARADWSTRVSMVERMTDYYRLKGEMPF